MKIAEYSKPSPKRLWFHRTASLVLLLVLSWLEWHGYLAGGIDAIALQMVASGLIWFCNGEYYSRAARKHRSYRALGWFLLVAIPLIYTILDLYMKLLKG